MIQRADQPWRTRQIRRYTAGIRYVASSRQGDVSYRAVEFDDRCEVKPVQEPFLLQKGHLSCEAADLRRDPFGSWTFRGQCCSVDESTAFRGLAMLACTDGFGRSTDESSASANDVEVKVVKSTQSCTFQLRLVIDFRPSVPNKRRPGPAVGDAT